MPGRQAHGGAPVKAPKVRNKSKKRSQNAFAIASQQVEDNVKVKQHRLGESEGGNRSSKRGRDNSEDEEEDEDENPRKQQKRPAKGRFDELDVDSGSDSEGNKWRLGEVDSDDDSDLDSDEAFGESDEEKFDEFAFSGSSQSKAVGKKSASRPSALTLDEEDSDVEEGSDEEDDFGDAGVDLATMLDERDSESEEDAPQDGSGEESSEGEDEDDDELSDDDESSMSSMEDEDMEDDQKLAALHELIGSLPSEPTKQVRSHKRENEGAEHATPSSFGLTSQKKLTLEDLGLPSIQDPLVRKSIKLIADEAKQSSKKVKSATLAVPLSRREQDRLDRAVAYEKSKDTLDRWTDTVKHNRRADHLVFPLPDADAASRNANSRLQSTTSVKPFNQLEATIQSILEESGLGSKDENGQEKAEFDELETKEISIEEVKARRARLRAARELMFREEKKAKRVKKIKSRSYRKVHRKDREKEDRIEREALLEAGIEPSEDEAEAQDRRRATERMGGKHRDSRWAKATKALGRAAWDDDARNGITDMARRDEELRKRVEGKSAKRDDDMFDSSSDGSDEEENSDEDEGFLLRKLEKVNNDGSREAPHGSGLMNMKFMLKSEAARKKQNDATVEEIRRELAGDSPDEEVDMDVGRRSYGPKDVESRSTIVKQKDFEEREDSEMEDWQDNEQEGGKGDSASNFAPKKAPRSILKSAPNPSKSKALSTPEPTSHTDNSAEGGAWSRPVSRKDAKSMSTEKRRKQKASEEADELDISNAAVIARPVKASKKAKANPVLLNGQESEDGDSDAAENSLPFAIKDLDLIKRAFAGADVVGDFENEKRQTVEDEDEKVIDSTLPGWGNWTGNGLSKKEKQRNREQRTLTKSEGIKEHNRKDSKLDKVIINEKRVKKNGKYLATSLPHPFESRQQYERSLRLPVGPEWTTKETFQDATKPRILLKQGIIAPMSKPMF